jgi:hypothetical protein
MTKNGTANNGNLTPYPGWDTAVKCLREGKTDIEAIHEVYDALQQPTVQNLAVIMSAVYADTYWNGVSMDSAKLSNSLQTALGFKKPDADSAANFAFSEWRGLLMRSDIYDNGQIPKTSPLNNSIDILNGGNDTFSLEQLLEKWNSTYWHYECEGVNNIYARAQSKNFQAEISDARAYMYIYSASLNPPPPKALKPLPTSDGQAYSKLYSNVSKSIPPSENAASNRFIWNNSEDGHYSFICCASTEFFKNDPMSVPIGNMNLHTWQMKNGALGLHNIDVPVISTQLQLERFVYF